MASCNWSRDMSPTSVFSSRSTFFLGGGLAFGDRFLRHGQHELDKQCAVPLLRAVIKCSVVPLLVLANQALHRDVDKQRIPPAKDQRLPEPAHSAVAVRKGVDELAMKYRTGDERMFPGRFKPVQKVAPQRRNQICRWCHMDRLLSSHYLNPAATKSPRRIEQPRHRHFVCRQQILFASRLPLLKKIVNLDGVLHLQDGRYLILAQSSSTASAPTYGPGQDMTMFGDLGKRQTAAESNHVGIFGSGFTINTPGMNGVGASLMIRRGRRCQSDQAQTNNKISGHSWRGDSLIL